MADNGGGICKCILAVLSAVLVAGGFAFLGYGLYLRQGQTETLEWMLMIHGVVVVILGTSGLCCVCKRSRSGLKGFCILLALLALADIIMGMVIEFCKHCFKIQEKHKLDKSQIMAAFLGNGILMIGALVCSMCLLKQSRRIQMEMTARFTANI